MRTIPVLFLIWFCYASVQTMRFDTRCKLIREIIRVGVLNKSFFGQWVCLIEQVSKRDTKALNVSPSGTIYYGLFQIPSRWCSPGKKGGECNIACESLLDDDIRDDSACAAQIFEKEGFKYWPLWTARCKNDIPFYTREIYKCPELSQSSPPRELYSDRLRNTRRMEGGRRRNFVIHA